MKALQALRTELGPDHCSSYLVDVRDRGALAAAVAGYVASRNGRLDAVFANAGVLFMGADEGITAEQKTLQIDVNVKGVLNTFDAALPHLKANFRRACRCNVLNLG